ncbi:MAG TPA: energy transducer TonB [Rhizobacter sp.]|nr:energy transducer TonB [Rhizobacter sp.]
MPSTPATVAPLPPTPLALRRPASASDGLSTGQRRGVIGAIALAHVGAIWAILQVPAVREAVMDAAPVFVELLAPPAPPAQPPAPPPPAIKAPPPVVMAAPPVPHAPVAAFETAPPPEVPSPPAPVQAVEAPPAPPAPMPAAAPKMIPAADVQYLETPLEYPRTSRRLQEAGTVTLRVYIDERGHVASVQVSKSSGFSRLDDAALTSVKKWRFKPYVVNGQPMAGYAVIPVMFELEK